MPGIGAGAGLGGDEARYGASELCGEVLSVDARLTDRVERGIDDDDAVDRLAVVGAVEQVAERAVVGSVDLEGLCALRVFRCLDVERSALHPRGEQGERGEVAVLIGQVLELALGEGCADGGAVCLERGRGGGDGDTRVAACGLEDQVYLRGCRRRRRHRLGRWKAGGGRLRSLG